MIAIFPSLGWQEMFLLLVIGLLLYGRNLPDAGRSLGRVVAQLKRSFHDFKDQIDRDGQIGDVKKALKETAREVQNVAKVPRALTKPGDALRDLTHEAMTSPVDGPDEDAIEDSDAAEHSVEDSTTETKPTSDPGVERDETSTPPTEDPSL